MQLIRAFTLICGQDEMPFLSIQLMYAIKGLGKMVYMDLDN
jgi:hypothetical protein